MVTAHTGGVMTEEEEVCVCECVYVMRVCNSIIIMIIMIIIIIIIMEGRYTKGRSMVLLAIISFSSLGKTINK